MRCNLFSKIYAPNRLLKKRDESAAVMLVPLNSYAGGSIDIEMTPH
jgi:hypothetical protein